MKMRTLFFMGLFLLIAAPGQAEPSSIERLLRSQMFNKEFEGFDRYHMVIETDQPQPDGSHEVTAVAIGRFMDQIQRVKAVFLIVDDRILGGQILEKTGLPPCGSSPEQSS